MTNLEQVGQSSQIQVGTEQVSKLEQLYEGKAKKIFKTSHPDFYWVTYKDDATAFNGEKKAQITNKGMLNNQITTIFFEYLAAQGIANHFVQSISPKEQLVRQVQIIPVEVVVRNVVAGSMAKRLGLTEGEPLKQPVLEFYYKDDALGDPFINEDHVYMLQLADNKQVQAMKELALRVNEALIPFLVEKNITLVDFKLEFGIGTDGQVLLADEISPDTCRFWDATTQEKLDKDRFRRDLGHVEAAYQEILERLGGQRHV